jgi:hypothetical protein
MGNHTPGEFGCPIEGCSVVRKNLMSLTQHLMTNHKLSIRQTWPYIDRFREPPGDWDKFKRDFEALEVGTP